MLATGPGLGAKSTGSCQPWRVGPPRELRGTEPALMAVPVLGEAIRAEVRSRTVPPSSTPASFSQLQG